MKNETKNMTKGATSARYFGAEYQANPGSSRIEYLDSSACYFREGVEAYEDLTAEEKAVCVREFNAGVAAEKALQ